MWRVFPRRETDASASGNGRSAGGPCERVVHNFIKPLGLASSFSIPHLTFLDARPFHPRLHRPRCLTAPFFASFRVRVSRLRGCVSTLDPLTSIRFEQLVPPLVRTTSILEERLRCGRSCGGILARSHLPKPGTRRVSLTLQHHVTRSSSAPGTMGQCLDYRARSPAAY